MDSFSKDMLTPLEHDLLGHFHSRYEEIGFPAPDAIAVKSRQSSSAGRFTYFEHAGQVRRGDGQLDLGRFSQINMDGLDAGASFWVEIEGGKVLYLEIAVNGDRPWDGSERRWSVCNPDTGAFSE